MTTSIVILILIGPVICFWLFAGLWLTDYLRTEERATYDFDLWENELKELRSGPD